MENKINVDIMENLIPMKIHKVILEELGNCQWFIASKNPISRFERISLKINSGFSITTVMHGKAEFNTILNVYGNIIYESILERLKIKANLYRLNWNMYFPGSETSLHKDIDIMGYKSVLYSLQNTDGGIVIGDVFYPDKEGQAKIFNSDIKHKGLGPTKDNVRFNLNIMFKPE
jgi:hypothetical protein